MKKPRNQCRYCQGEGLSLPWARLGYRVVIGEPLGDVRHPRVQCDHCLRPADAPTLMEVKSTLLKNRT